MGRQLTRVSARALLAQTVTLCATAAAAAPLLSLPVAIGVMSGCIGAPPMTP